MKRDGKLIAGVVFIGAGIVVAIIGYLGVSRETEVAFQLPYFASAGIGALLSLGIGATLVVGSQIEADTKRMDDVEDAVRMLSNEIARLSDGLSVPRGSDLQLVRRKRA